jgi:hypothetical protein
MDHFFSMLWHELLNHEIHGVMAGKTEAYVLCSCGKIWRTTETENQGAEWPPF